MKRKELWPVVLSRRGPRSREGSCAAAVTPVAYAMRQHCAAAGVAHHGRPGQQAVPRREAKPGPAGRRLHTGSGVPGTPG